MLGASGMGSSKDHSLFPDVKTTAGRRRSLEFASGGALILALLYALRVVVLLTAPESARIEITISVAFCALGFAFATLIRRNTFVRCALSILLVWALAELVLRFLNGQLLGTMLTLLVVFCLLLGLRAAFVRSPVPPAS